MASIWDKLKKKGVSEVGFGFSEWRFEKGDRKSDSSSKDSEYKNKLSQSIDWQNPERHAMQTS